MIIHRKYMFIIFNIIKYFIYYILSACVWEKHEDVGIRISLNIYRVKKKNKIKFHR